MMAEMLAGFLADLARQPALLLAAIFAASLLLEDAAIIAAGLLAAHMLVDPIGAITVLVVGTTAGDMALHCAGRWARRVGWVRRQRARPAAARALQWLARNWWAALAVARFAPGLRLPVYLGSGVLRLSPLPCIAVIGAASLVWTPGLFLLSKAGGERLGDAPLHMVTVAILTPLAAFALIRHALSVRRCSGSTGELQ